MRDTLESRLAKCIARKRRDVFLRADFNDLGGYDQVGRALLVLVREGKLTKIGYGLYARARPSRLDGSPTLTKGLRELTDDALRRLGVKPSPTRLERAYVAGETTQVPAGRRVAVNKRIRRQIGFNGVTMSFERARPPAP